MDNQTSQQVPAFQDEPFSLKKYIFIALFLAVLAIIVGILFYIIIPKYYYKVNVYGGLSSDLIIPTQATTAPQTTTAPQINLKNDNLLKISTTTDSGLSVVIIFARCDNQIQKAENEKVWQICFGSSRNSVYDKDGIEVWNLAREVNIAKFGVFDTKAENYPYVIGVDFGNHTPNQKELEYFRKEMSNLFIENVIDNNPCWGIPDGKCRE